MIIWKMGGISLQCAHIYRTPGKSRTGFRSMDVYLQKFGCYHKDSKLCL